MGLDFPLGLQDMQRLVVQLGREQDWDWDKGTEKGLLIDLDMLGYCHVANCLLVDQHVLDHVQVDCHLGCKSMLIGLHSSLQDTLAALWDTWNWLQVRLRQDMVEQKVLGGKELPERIHSLGGLLGVRSSNTTSVKLLLLLLLSFVGAASLGF